MWAKNRSPLDSVLGVPESVSATEGLVHLLSSDVTERLEVDLLLTTRRLSIADLSGVPSIFKMISLCARLGGIWESSYRQSTAPAYDGEICLPWNHAQRVCAS